MTDTMRAAVFEGKNQIRIEDRPVPVCGPTDAAMCIDGEEAVRVVGQTCGWPAAHSRERYDAVGCNDALGYD